MKIENIFSKALFLTMSFQLNLSQRMKQKQLSRTIFSIEIYESKWSVDVNNKYLSPTRFISCGIKENALQNASSL